MIRLGSRDVAPLNGIEIPRFVGLAVPQEFRFAGTLWDDCEFHLGTREKIGDP